MNPRSVFMAIRSLVLLWAWVLVSTAQAEEARFFRVSGPAATTITAFRSNGMLVWSNALAGTNYVVQTATTLNGVTNWVDYVQLPVTNAVNTNLLFDFNPPADMALIPAGSFTMGDTFGDARDTNQWLLHNVYVSAFYMDRYAVTYSLWTNVYQWATNHGYTFDHPGSGKALNHPVEAVDWYDCVKWCNARSEQAGVVPAYYTNAAQTVVYRTGQVDVDNSSVKWNSGYRLPTEAEWEKAARGGASGQRFPWGNTITHSNAIYWSDSRYAYDVSPTRGCHPTFTDGVFCYTSPVGYFAPNGYGLYDMAGNVFQWCWDWSSFYGSASQNDPRGPTTTSGSVLRMFRGGSYNGLAIGCRAAFRNGTYPAGLNGIFGFRTVLSPGQ